MTHEGSARVIALTLEPGGFAGIRLACSGSLAPRAGQALSVCAPATDWFRRTLVPVRCQPDGLVALLPEGVSWQIDSDLHALGPLGSGFTPPRTGRWLLAGIGLPGEHLRPLVDLGLAAGAELAFVSDDPPAGLPPDVEVLAALEEARHWPDYVAVETTLEMGGEVGSWLARGLDLNHRQVHGQALLTGELPCGMGGCMACAVKIARRTLVTCRQGPVFPLHELMH